MTSFGAGRPHSENVSKHTGGDHRQVPGAARFSDRLEIIDGVEIAGHRQQSDLSPVLVHAAQLREAGFREAMRTAGLEVVEELVRDARYDPDTAYAVCGELLELADPPTAIFAANDVTALRAIAAAQARGLRVPEDLSVVGFDDIPDATLNNPPITTMRQPLQDMGEAAMQMLLDILEGKEHVQHVRMATELVVRASTSPPAAPKN